MRTINILIQYYFFVLVIICEILIRIKDRLQFTLLYLGASITFLVLGAGLGIFLGFAALYKCAETFARYLTAIIVFIFLAILIGIVMIFARLFDSDELRKTAHEYVYMLSAAQLAIFGIEVDITGFIWNCDEPLMIVSNHVSWIDMFVLAYVFRGKPTTAISKWQNFLIPLFGQVIWLLYVIPVARNHGDPEGDKRRMRKVAAICKKIFFNLLAFAEGTRTLDGELQEFKWGVFKLSKETGMKIVPIMMNGLYELNNKNMLLTKSGKMSVVIGGLIDPADYSVEELRKHTREVMLRMGTK